ncbi:putative addiction module CopG family antidote [Rhizobium sp. BK376]|nr:putative addiction module CopG family antidote [Rhizobium sp. BK376]
MNLVSADGVASDIGKCRARNLGECMARSEIENACGTKFGLKRGGPVDRSQNLRCKPSCRGCRSDDTFSAFDKLCQSQLPWTQQEDSNGYDERIFSGSNEDCVEQRARTGRYSNSSGYVRDLIRKDQERNDKMATMQRFLDDGLKSGIAEQGVHVFGSAHASVLMVTYFRCLISLPQIRAWRVSEKWYRRQFASALSKPTLLFTRWKKVETSR